ncbi:MAG: alpha-galactosidase [Ectothiorhodospiraceae bacterium AqS1]|nr:alpha-galactosidase [Ectothiorhodospiraceae bacterium AqS1]
MTQCLRLDDARQTLVFASQDDHLPEIIYWGRSLAPDEDLEALAAASRIDITGGMLDAVSPLTLCPLAIDTFPGQAGLILRRKDGSALHPGLRLVSASASSNRIRFEACDDAAGLRWHALFLIDPETSVIACHAGIRSLEAIHLDWLAAPVFPAPQQGREMIEFSGRWCGEFQTSTHAWSAGMRARNNPTGRTGHEHFPGLYLPGRGATNTSGQVHACHYAWSGGHSMIAEELPDGRRQVQFGHARGSEPDAGTEFTTASLYLAWSDAGLNGAATALQRHLRDRVVRWPEASKPRPVHYNCWEAIYFDHDIRTLSDIAKRAADFGAERFVLDDGWFGARNDDTSSLGDWRVDRRKYPQGLTPLIDEVRSLGMGFGLWLEPEMVSCDSDLARAHPQWIAGASDQIEGRHQRVLDLKRGDVFEYLFQCLHRLLSDHDIEYIKWDHNRVLPLADAGQTRALLALLDRLRLAHPKVEIESCASGGGRIDYGILERCPRIWLSDSNDALERLRIQHDAALFLPAAVTGSHVGPRQCHTSGRSLDIHLRAWVAAQRHFGLEMDLRELDEEEAAALERVCRWWKDNRDWLFHADILRLDSADEAIIAEMQLAKTQDRFVVFAAKAHTSRQIAPRPLTLTGLHPAARYRIDLITRDRCPTLSRGDPLLKSAPLEAGGAWLMQAGLNLPWSFPATIHVIEGLKLD